MSPEETEFTKISDNGGPDEYGNRLTFTFKDWGFIAFNYQGYFDGTGSLEITIQDEDQKSHEATTQLIFEKEIKILRDYLSAMLKEEKDHD
jgi:hypothetical protein